MLDILPNQVYNAIQKHLISRANEAQEGWEAGRDEEDTLTGHLGAILQTTWSAQVRSNGHRWQWRVTYKKFRGRGQGALEKKCGADGLVQIEVMQQDKQRLFQKSILFQAKKGDIRRSKDLTEQVRKMERKASDGSAVFYYDEDDYGAIAGNEYLSKIKERAILARGPKHKLGILLGEQFLACTIGIQGMYYDAMRRTLIVPHDQTNHFVYLPLGHRISIDVFRA